MDMTQQQRIDAIYKAVPREPIPHELGGGIYYTCFWMACGNTVTRWQNYCDQCGQRIKWDKEE